jgi:REP element-mobilizing transposase RayT
MHLSDSEFATLAQVIAEQRAEHRFLLTAWVFLPDHGHAIFYPRQPLTTFVSLGFVVRVFDVLC